jgi:RNA polymerase sigma factor for flagellar operon FliA
MRSNGEGSARTKTIILSELWRRYKSTGDRATRDQLILAYSPLVKYIAGKIAGRMPDHVELADLVSFGLGGLINAVERYEPSRGVKFESYAATRVRGAIIDELRSRDWVPRAVRTEARDLSAATFELQTRLQRAPSEAELADELSLDVTELRSALSRAAETRMLALDEVAAGDRGRGQPSTMLDLLPDTRAPDPADSAAASELRDRIAHAVERLPPQEQLVLGLRYQQELRYAEIGEILGVTESRISQIHAQALVLMGALMPDEALAV